MSQRVGWLLVLIIVCLFVDLLLSLCFFSLCLSLFFDLVSVAQQSLSVIEKRKGAKREREKRDGR